jgi:hypothetical protein
MGLGRSHLRVIANPDNPERSGAIAKSGGKPGNGYGDTNHIHTGAPGQIKKAEGGGSSSQPKKNK